MLLVVKTFPLVALAGLLVAGAAFAQDAAKADAGKKPEPQITVKGTSSEEEAKRVLRGNALLARCVIKPVMTDEEIGLCKEAYQKSR